MSRDDRRAAQVLLLLLLAGIGVRMLGVAGPAPGGVAFWLEQGEERPVRDSVEAAAARLGRPLEPGERIDVDEVGVVELTRLPRIGPALAARIVADREERGAFGSLEALIRVSGIGPASLEALAPHVRFSGRRNSLLGPRKGVEKVSVNTAGVAELANLPGVGPSRARAIVEDRRRHGPFRSLNDLGRVPGIGPKTLQRLADLVVVP